MKVKKITDLLVLALLLPILGCDALTGPERGLSLDIINEAQISWRVENITRSELVFTSLSSGGENVFFDRCDSRRDDCEITLTATPTISPPPGCDRWELEVEEFDIPHDEREHDVWELDDPDPRPRGCDR